MSAPKTQRELILHNAALGLYPEPFRSAMVAGCDGKRFSARRAALALVEINRQIAQQQRAAAKPAPRLRKKSVAASD